MAIRKRSISGKLFSIVVLPITMLGVFIIFFGVVLLYRNYTQSIHDELASTASIMLDCLNLTIRGDYSYESGMLLKGDLNITDSTMLYRVKESSQIDTTIFWGDTRILTTVEDEYGVSAVGTKADDDVTEVVLDEGKNYYSQSLDINGVPYIGYYMPLENRNHKVVGMMFAGKKKSQIYWNIATIVGWFLAFSVISVVIAALLSRRFSKRMILDVGGINHFLRDISEGDLTVNLEERILKRNDEIGEIAAYASKMRGDLQMLIEMDPLTSLLNRRSCNNRLNALMEKGDTFCIVMCDIDWFKKINDQYGHDAGDYVLVTVAGCFRESVENCGFASRWGGEEFLLIYNLDEKETYQKVEELQKVIREYPFVFDGQEIRLTMTFGIEGRGQEESYETIITRADGKLYTGKENGRDQIVS